MRFAYISSADLRIHSDNTSGVGNMSSAGGSKQRAVTPDFSIIENSGQAEEDEHVLVLDFVESSKKKTKVEVARSVGRSSFCRRLIIRLQWYQPELCATAEHEPTGSEETH